MRYLLILLIVFPFFSFGQTKHCKDPKGKKQGIHYDYSNSWLLERTAKKDTTNGEELYYYPSGALRAKGKRINGEWVEFFESGNIKIKQTYVQGKVLGDTYCYSENGSILLPRFIPQTLVKNDTSILNNSDLNLYRLFDTRDSANDIINFQSSLFDTIQICDNGNLTIHVGSIHFLIKPSLLSVHVSADTTCKGIITGQSCVTNRKGMESVNRDDDTRNVSEKKVFKTQIGKIEIESKKKRCGDTGHHSLKITRDDKWIYFKDIGNLIFFEHDIDKGGKIELFILNFFCCEERLEIYKIDDR